ncbi:hypothetical protein [Bradyrhizobium zhanjiangense]|uniref:Uncharacterized protein n=1 Tax=Bradyrhizobium zhanjiangense TaxID=1325107 RepID=A0ABY0DMV0_9BRAD|nr:hypothetical protein [Bradyrhizobium zhanjiangense]RXG96363.1 hypothetical protein EAS62_12285 [Bradyrhizobium zhanjiangense]
MLVVLILIAIWLFVALPLIWYGEWPTNEDKSVTILNGSSGFILLAFSVALGAYIRTVYAASVETFDEVYCEKLPAWPFETDYTRDRLHNLEFAQRWLRLVTILMFIFMFFSSLRIVASALNAITPVIEIWLLRWCDLGLIIFLTGSFLIMWGTHWVSSSKERRCREAMRKAFDQKRFLRKSAGQRIVEHLD